MNREKMRGIVRNCILIFAILIFILNCAKAEFSVQNKVANVVISGILWGDCGPYGSIMPGVTSEVVTITDSNDFGRNIITFFMQAKNNSVYLKTVEEHSLFDTDYKVWVIDNETQVINPLDVRSVSGDETIAMKDLIMLLDENSVEYEVLFNQ